MTNFKPTPEQQAALDAFATGEDMVIEAGAGTGKTSTLKLLARSTTRKGLYVAYNKAIATEAGQDFPSNVKCRTAHSLAYAAVGRQYSRRLNGPRVPSRKLVAFLGIPDGLRLDEDNTLPAWTLGRMAMDTVRRFCQTADRQITTYHVPRTKGLENHQDTIAAFILPFAQRAWDDLQKAQGTVKFEHDHYLKIWALTRPRLNFDFILFDEAQDANPVIADIIECQSCQKIMVGDASQAIYGWRGAVDAMSSFAAAHRLVLSQSFRFGPAVAEIANKWLELLDAPLRLKGFEPIASTVVLESEGFNPDAILCRTNAAVVSYAMNAIAQGKKVAVVGGMGEIKRFTEGARDLMDGKRSSHPDLTAFRSWAEVQEYAQSDEGRDLKTMVTLIANYGVEAILEVCDASVNEDRADLIVSTAHKAKGREWDAVLIADDFKAPAEGEEVSRPEAMLAYVACTRARKSLDYTGVSWITTYAAQVA